MKKRLIIIVTTLVSAVWPALSNTYGGGTGTQQDPYHITNLLQLRALSETAADWNKHFILTADIDASSSSSWNSNAGFSPVGNTSSPFTGTFDGQNHTISNLRINRSTDYIGLFGYIVDAKVINIKLYGCRIKGKENTGSLAGYCQSSIISNCSTVAGMLQGTNGNNVGGLIGRAQSGSELSYCYSKTEVQSGYGFVGALLGNLMYDSSMRYCFAVKRLYSTNRSSAICFGGLVARNHRSVIENCYSLGYVGGNNEVGGFVGRNSSNTTGCTINNCYAAGQVVATNHYTQIKGGFAGKNDANSSISNCYFDTQTSMLSAAIGQDANGQSVTGYTTAQFALSANFSTWDFDDVWTIETIGELSAAPRPYLQWQLGYALEFVTQGNGVITGDTVQTVERAGAANPVTAVPDNGWQFKAWHNEAGNIYSSDSTLNVTNISDNMVLTAVFERPTGMEQTLRSSDVVMYPNPTRGELTVQSEYTVKSIRITDLQGKVLRQWKPNSTETFVDIAYLAKGIYLIQIRTNKGAVVKKLSLL